MDIQCKVTVYVNLTIVPLCLPRLGAMPVSTGFALRVDDGDDRRARLLDWLRGLGGAALCVREDAEGNLHYHCYFEDHRTLAALRKSVQRNIVGESGGNGVYSLKPCTSEPDGYLQYMCKGDSVDLGPVVVFQFGLRMTAANIQKWHHDYWVTNQSIQANRLKRKKITNATIVERVEEECKHQGVAWSNSQLIAEVYIRMQVAARKSINTFAARAIVNTVQVLLCPDDEALNRLSERIAYMQ